MLSHSLFCEYNEGNTLEDDVIEWIKERHTLWSFLGHWWYVCESVSTGQSVWEVCQQLYLQSKKENVAVDCGGC